MPDLTSGADRAVIAKPGELVSDDVMGLDGARSSVVSQPPESPGVAHGEHVNGVDDLRAELPVLDIVKLGDMLCGTNRDPWPVAKEYFDCTDHTSDDLVDWLGDKGFEQCSNCDEWNRDTDIGPYGECIDCQEGDDD